MAWACVWLFDWALDFNPIFIGARLALIWKRSFYPGASNRWNRFYTVLILASFSRKINQKMYNGERKYVLRMCNSKQFVIICRKDLFKYSFSIALAPDFVGIIRCSVCRYFGDGWYFSYILKGLTDSSLWTVRCIYIIDSLFTCRNINVILMWIETDVFVDILYFVVQDIHDKRL